MIKKIYYILFIPLVLLANSFTNAETPLDSLFIFLKSAKTDSAKVGLYSAITNVCEMEDIPKYTSLGLKLINSKTLSTTHPQYKFFQTEKARLFNNIGYYHYSNLHSLKCIEAYQNAILILEKIKTDDDLLASLYNNVSSQYIFIRNFTKPIEYMYKVILIDKKLGKESVLALDYSNLSSAYFYLNNKDSSTFYAYEALKLKIKLGDKVGETNTLYNLASNFFKWKDLDRAKVLFEEAAQSFQKIKVIPDSSALIGIYMWEGKWKAHLKDYKLADSHLKKALSLCYRFQKFTELQDIYMDLYKINKKLKQFNESLLYLERLLKLQDSTSNANIEKEAALKVAKFDYDKKEILLKAEQEKQLAIGKERERQQNNLLIFSVLVILLVIVFLVIIYKRWQIVSKQNKIIEEQKREVDEQRNLADSRREIAEAQKAIIEAQKHEVDSAYEKLHEKNKEVMDSIHYAARIQRSLITNEKYIAKFLNRK